MTRKEIEKKLEDLKGQASTQATEWRELIDDMQSYFDEKSLKWQEGEKGDEYQDWLQRVEDTIDKLDEIADFSLD